MALCRVEHNQGVLGILLTICVCVFASHSLKNAESLPIITSSFIHPTHTHTHAYKRRGEMEESNK